MLAHGVRRVIVISSLAEERHLESAVERGMAVMSYDRRATPGQPVFLLSIGGYHPQFDPPGALRGLSSCTGKDFCHFALNDTKGRRIIVPGAKIVVLGGPSMLIGLCSIGCSTTLPK